jgi:hypothetical protein
MPQRTFDAISSSSDVPPAASSEDVSIRGHAPTTATSPLRRVVRSIRANY